MAGFVSSFAMGPSWAATCPASCISINNLTTDPSFLDTALKFTSVGSVAETLSAQIQVGTYYSFSFFVGTPAGSTTPTTVQATLLESTNNGPYVTDSILHNPI